jgi:hypothetical protein
VQANGVVVPPGRYETRDWDQRGSRPSHASRIIGYCCVAVLRTEKGNFTDFRLPLKSGHPQHRHLRLLSARSRHLPIFSSPVGSMRSETPLSVGDRHVFYGGVSSTHFGRCLVEPSRGRAVPYRRIQILPNPKPADTRRVVRSQAARGGQ